MELLGVVLVEPAIKRFSGKKRAAANERRVSIHCPSSPSPNTYFAVAGIRQPRHRGASKVQPILSFDTEICYQ